MDRSMDKVSSCAARGWEFYSSLSLLGEEPAWLALGQLHSPRVPLEEGDGNALLNRLYLENPQKGRWIRSLAVQPEVGSSIPH